MPIVTITISIDTGKETPAQRRVRIAETQNGRKSWYKSRQIYLLPIRDSELRTIEQALCKYKHQV